MGHSRTVRTPAVPATLPARPLRTHQQQLLGTVQAIAAGGASDVHDILAAVTPGGGKSLLPVLAAHALITAGAFTCQSALKKDPWIGVQSGPRRERLVPVVHRHSPRAAECR